MKQTYETPSAEKIQFNYRDQVVVASGMNNNMLGTVTTGCVADLNED